MKQGTHIIALSPGDITIQVVPKFLNETNNKVNIPEEDLGYSIPMRLFLTDTFEKEFCGVFEIGTIFFNENIRRDILDELYRDQVTFDIFIRQRKVSNEEIGLGPKVLQEYRNCKFYRQEFYVPEVGLTAFYRYHFSNSQEPWDIPTEKIEALRMPNQYMYDYAVSKATKNLQYTLKDIHEDQVKKDEKKELTVKEYIALVKSNGDQ